MARERLESSQFRDLAVKSILELGIKIFALKQLSLDYQTLYECGYFSSGSSRLLDLAYRSLLTQLRPQMIPIVECFPDYCRFVPTTIGNEYGDIYRFQEVLLLLIFQDACM